ncbi:MAG: FAD binding domain-containing protein [Deltaproteobacteria bacterium]|nr:FAD binding domain-containing protein [Deltaproteobacteria bacterium]
MQNFQFYSTSSLEDGLDYLAERAGGCKIIAGGTDLIPTLRKADLSFSVTRQKSDPKSVSDRDELCKIVAGGGDVIPMMPKDAHPDYVLNILEIEELKGVTETDDAVRIGPTTTFTEMMESEVLSRCLPLLVQAASSVGGPQIRNRGTIGGNIVSNAPCADVLPAVLALEGNLELHSKKSGMRILPVAEALEAPYKTSIAADEILTGILISKLSAGTRSGFEKLGRRNAMTTARMNMSVVFKLEDDGTISDLRIVPGAVMPVTRRMTAAEEILLGKKPEAPLIEESATLMTESIFKITGMRWSTEYKKPVVQNIFKRILKQLLQDN